MIEIDLSQGWQVLQDVHDRGELLGLFEPDFRTTIGKGVSEWQPLPRLAHLQTIFALQPYFGRELRYFNDHAWWYRLDFDAPSTPATLARLTFEGVDYFAKAWLNGQLLGEHEGYFEPFEFDVNEILHRDQPNTLVVRVSAPWDKEVPEGRADDYSLLVIRNQIKGLYEHCDTFVQRDVNPVGIWRPVKLTMSDTCLPGGRLHATAQVTEGSAAKPVAITWPVLAGHKIEGGEFNAWIEEVDTGLVVAQEKRTVTLTQGGNQLQTSLSIDQPRLWNTWDRGEAARYCARVSLHTDGRSLLSDRVIFGVQTVTMTRTENETSVSLNGKKLFVRGTAYMPDVYMSKMNTARYERDLAAMRRVGVNTVRVHVHVELPEFYDICDRLGLLVLQDTDLNWNFPTDDEFARRAVAVSSAMIDMLKDHPCILGWVCMNESRSPEANRIGEAIEQAAHRLDPARPTIRNSWDEFDLASGDSHYYDGGLGGGKYTDIVRRNHKMLSEFGADVPASMANLRSVPALAKRLEKLAPHIPDLHEYQYRLIKYQIEHLRIRKYNPCSGYFHFMWIDLCPQSFYGVYDYWGNPKSDGPGGDGGLRAFEEANSPIGIFMEHVDQPEAIWAVNDLDRDIDGCLAQWWVTTQEGREIAGGEQELSLPADTGVRVAELSFPVQSDVKYRVHLALRDAQGNDLARNRYDDPFHHPTLRPGYPWRIDHEIGVRLWDA